MSPQMFFVVVGKVSLFGSCVPKKVASGRKKAVMQIKDTRAFDRLLVKGILLSHIRTLHSGRCGFMSLSLAWLTVTHGFSGFL